MSALERTGRLRRAIAPVEDGHYEFVLTLLVAGYLASALTESTWVSVLTVLLYVGALVLAIQAARLRGSQAWALRIGLAVGSLAALVLLLAGGGQVVRGVAAAWLALVLGVTIVLVVRHILRHPVVTVQTIAGALSAYLLIGLMFAEIFTAMSRLGTGSFFAGGQVADAPTVQYFSFSTLTTLGYGDVTAAGEAGRAVAVLEALLGQIFLVTLVARLVSNFGAVAAREATRNGRPDPADPSPPDDEG